MPTTDEQWTVAQSWIGTTETRVTFDERYDRLDSLDEAIKESMRAQLAVLVFDQPAGVGLSSGDNFQFGENIRTIRENLAKFEDEGGTESGGAPRTYRRYRPTPR